MKVIGNGLVGSAFFQTQAEIRNAPIIDLTAGVSNSRLTDDRAFSREVDLVSRLSNQAKDDGTRVIYISTYSVHENWVRPSKYVTSKLRCENLVMKMDPCNRILRLANVVGPIRKYSKHPTTSYFPHSIRQQL